ncbi:hypothetical protein ACJMK2_041603 [Sinanodonta woodiana]|uniref:BTB domain-containing protein n=1 Tax=Sinanodonta woodiana TaxID=1069815 RepID=A0ABD3W5D6_SINWO
MNSPENHAEEEDIQICLLVEGQKFYCSRALLAKHSEYFRAMFCSGMIESKSDTITLHGVQSTAVGSLLDFMSGRKQLDLLGNDMTSIITAACMYQINSAICACCQDLIKRIDNQTCLDIMLLAETFSLNTVYNMARRHALWFFPSIWSIAEDFVDLEKEPLQSYLSDPMLNTSSELEVFQALEKWINQDRPGRLPVFSQLLFDCIYVKDIEDEEIEVIMSSPLVELNPEVISWIQQHKQQQRPETWIPLRHVPYKLVLVGGWRKVENRRVPCLDMFSFDINSGNLQSVIDLPSLFNEQQISPDIGYSVCVVGKDLYLAGGEAVLGKSKWMMDVWKYDGFEESWKIVTSLKGPRRHHGMCSDDDSFYLLGGFGRYRVMLDSIEQYHCTKDEWVTLRPMLQPEFNPGVAVHRNKLYCIKSVIQSYDLQTGSWTLIKHNLDCGITGSVYIYHNFIYIKSSVTDSFVRLNCTNNTFEKLDGFESSDVTFSVERGKIYVYDGDNHTLFSCSMNGKFLKPIMKEMPERLQVSESQMVLLPSYPKWKEEI